MNILVINDLVDVYGLHRAISSNFIKLLENLVVFLILRKRRLNLVLTSQRKRLILDKLRAEGQIIAKSVSHELGLSEDTIRRDLRELAQEGLLQRVHGGALPASPAVADFAGRQLWNGRKMRLAVPLRRWFAPARSSFWTAALRQFT
jgi:predicted transcriptional regulator